MCDLMYCVIIILYELFFIMVLSRIEESVFKLDVNIIKLDDFLLVFFKIDGERFKEMWMFKF